MAVIGYRHTGLIVSDLEKSLDFYHSFLGLEVVQIHVDRSQYISEVTNVKDIVAKYAKLRVPGGTTLELLSYPSHPRSRVDRQLIQPGEAHLAFEIYSASDMYEKVKFAGIQCLSAPVLSSEKIANVFFCLDPDGYRIEFVEMLTSNYEWKISHES